MAEAFVLDASVAMAWFLEGHKQPEMRYAAGVMNYLKATEGDCLVPFVWHAEVAAVLLRNHRARRAGCDKAWLEGAMLTVQGLNIVTHHQAAGMQEIIRMGLAYHLQGYDALYFDLAKINGLPIATFDRGILTACKRFGVERLDV